MQIVLSLSPGRSAGVQLPQLPLGATVRFYSCLNKSGATSQRLVLEPFVAFPPFFREGHRSNPVLLLEPELQELQLDLLSRFDPKRLLVFLQSSQHYRLEEAVLVRFALWPTVYYLLIYTNVLSLLYESVFPCR